MKEEIKDRIGKFLLPRLEDYIFDELSEDYQKRAGLGNTLKGVPVPIKKTEIRELSNVKIARNMAFVMGSDVNFRYRDNYIEYIMKTFGEDFIKALIAEGVQVAAREDYEEACILFRAVLQMDEGSTDGLYCYGRACLDAYKDSEDE